MCIIRSILVLICSFLLTGDLLAGTDAGSDTSTQAPDVRLALTHATGAPGHVVVIQVLIDNASGVAGANLAVSYVPTVLTPTIVEASSLVTNGNLILVPTFETSGLVRVALAGAVPLPAGEGPLFSIVFDIAPDAEEGTYPLYLVGTTIVNELGVPVLTAAEQGSVIVKITPGDIDQDGTVTTNDVQQALKFATMQDTPTARQMTAADVNEDGKVTIGDVVLIQRLVAGLKDGAPKPAVPMVTHESVMYASISEAVRVNGANGLGTVEQVSGDLTYITGLNGSAPLWSRLNIQNGHAEAVRLEVVKKLDEILVARVVKANGTPIKPGDPVALDGSASIRTGRKARRVVHACQVEEGPFLDGRLDDDVWNRATPIEGFVQRDPNYWMPGSERTVARVLYDHDTIYFGFECFQSSALVANHMRRDSELSGDDNIQILLDTYNDRRNGFFFFVNALGAQLDLMLSNEGRTYNRDWDCNWVSKTHRYSDRWTAEIAIPFSQLRFKQSDEMIWGINLARFIAGKNEAMQLVVGQQSSSSTERYRTADIGELRGLGRIRSRRPIQVKPYLLPGTTKDFQAAAPAENRTMETGVDVRYGMTSNISLDLSYNTDFAQVEGDQEQTNLTQFKLFFPEKREFFLEGSNLFSFGEQARRTGSGTRPPTLLFYSRRIGLEEGNKIPIIVGSKIAGKEGRTSVGVLNVLTDAGTFIDDEDTIQVHRTNYSVLRIQRDLFSRSNIGFIMVNKQVDDPNGGWNQYNRAGGIDFSYSPSDNLNFQGFVARTWDSIQGDADDARWAYMNYRGSKFWARLRYLDVEDQFEPAVGFVNRRSGLEGFRRYDVYLRIRPRPKFGNIRYMSIGPEFEIVSDRNNDVKYWKAELSWWTLFNTGDYWRIQLERTYDVVEDSFSPSNRHSDVEIPAGTYTFTTITTGPRPSRSRKFRPGITFEAGTYYTGRRYTIRSESAILPSGRFGLQLSYSGNWLRLPQGNLSIHTLSSRLLYSFSTDFFAKLFAQWNNDKEFVSANLLINYRYRPGSDIFIVFDNAYGTETGFERQNRSVLFKFSYLLNL